VSVVYPHCKRKSPLPPLLRGAKPKAVRVLSPLKEPSAGRSMPLSPTEFDDQFHPENPQALVLQITLQDFQGEKLPAAEGSWGDARQGRGVQHSLCPRFSSIN
jgi:hypothetical protein